MPSHDTVFDPTLGERRNHLRELADLEPNDFVNERGKSRVCFALDGDGYQAFNPLAAGLACQFERQGAVAGDESESVEF